MWLKRGESPRDPVAEGMTDDEGLVETKVVQDRRNVEGEVIECEIGDWSSACSDATRLWSDRLETRVSH
jgi:hypothetical protein